MKTRVLLLSLTLVVACGETGSGSSTGSASEGSASTGGPTTGGPTTGGPTTGATGSGTGSTAEGSGSSGGGATTGTSGSSGGTTGGASLAEEYCACMLENCHDQYHATWGEDHVMSEMMCLAYAGALPTVGMPAMTGDSLECRYYACTQLDCASTLDGGVCM